MTHSNPFRGEFVFLKDGALTCIWRSVQLHLLGVGGTHHQWSYYLVLYADLGHQRYFNI